MRNQLKVLVGLFLAFFILDSYAIQVNVQASSSAVSGLGFAVNGKNHGGAGHSYSISNMPAGGTFIFGIRVNGIFGNDVTCYAAGKKSVRLDHDSTAVLNYDGHQCTAKIYKLGK